MIYTPATENNNPERSKARKRKIIRFNPSYSIDMETNIGKTLLQLVKKHFSRKNSFHKIFNKNTIKISYSCMRNISSMIASRNKSILRPAAEEYGCNRRNKDSCPLQNQCLTPKVIYETTVWILQCGTTVWASLAKWLSVRLRTKWLWVRVPLQ